MYINLAILLEIVLNLKFEYTKIVIFDVFMKGEADALSVEGFFAAMYWLLIIENELLRAVIYALLGDVLVGEKNFLLQPFTVDHQNVFI